MNILIHWKDEFNLGIKRMDEQHKKIVDMINILYDSYVRNEQDNTLQQIISDMIDYAFVHFKDEEKFFDEFGYKGASSHIEEHRFFLKKAEMLHASNRSHDRAFKREVLFFLQEWFINHILNSDKKYRECFIKGGLL